MIVIENKGKLKFFEGERELTMQEGFKRLDQLYINEPIDSKKAIDNLKEKYLEGHNETYESTVL